MQSEESALTRYRTLYASEPHLFENPVDCPIGILTRSDEIQRAKNEVIVERKAAGWPVNDVRVGVLAEDPYIGYVIRDAVRFSDGRSGLYNRVVATGGVVILPIMPEGGIALIRIFRHAPRRWFLEAPQGLLPAHSNPAEEARRELLEEMGAIVGNLTPLGEMYTSTALTSETLQMFAAQISSFGKPQLNEGIESIRVVAREEIDCLVANGTICDGPTMSLVVRARIRRLI